ncbi:Ig-like domain-containing protein [Tunturiibacter gelidiferens]
MGVQPATLQLGVTPASASTDTIPPASVITAPASNSTLIAGKSITVTGLASDSGGVVAGVEFSGDGGKTWHPATGRSNWSFVWTPNAVGSITLLSRAVDDSANIETPGSGVSVNVVPATCPCSIWNSSNIPATVDSGPDNAVELGVKFRADAGVRSPAFVSIKPPRIPVPIQATFGPAQEPCWGPQLLQARAPLAGSRLASRRQYR